MAHHKRWRTTETVQRRARELRRNQTPAERKLWAKLRGKQLCGLKFRRQHPIGRYITDFCCVSHKLVIEIDGDSHASQAEYDQARTAYLQERGHTVIRFTNEQVNHQLDAVLDEIVRQRDAFPHPSPPPPGGGGSNLPPRLRGGLRGGKTRRTNCD